MQARCEALVNGDQGFFFHNYFCFIFLQFCVRIVEISLGPREMRVSVMQQLSLFELEQNNRIQTEPKAFGFFDGKELGTFKDSMRSPVHRWFRYPAGYSYRLVYACLDSFGVIPGNWVYDPFSGCGTTLVAAKQRGINAYGVEAHAFVKWVADVKLYWEYDLDWLRKQINELLTQAEVFVREHAVDSEALQAAFPDLVYKCYHAHDLQVLYVLREFVLSKVSEVHVRDLFKLALTDSLRAAAAAGTGWPYISPRKNNGDKPPKGALNVFRETVTRMYSDLCAIRASAEDCSKCHIENVLGDSRQRQDLEDGQAKLALTSPPYLNNYDYADRTRLETYFWGIASSWGDISRNFRDKLMIAATTQIQRGLHDVHTVLDREIAEADNDVHNYLQRSVLELSKLRLEKGGKKDYDLMVALYFNDVLKVLKETYRVLAGGGHFCLVLGDSAPYGVYIPTHDLIGRLSVGIGFKGYTYHKLRDRGDKWKQNPQRHNVELREGIAVLTK